MANTTAFLMVHVFYRGIYCTSERLYGFCDALRECMQLKRNGYCYQLEVYTCIGGSVFPAGVVCNG